LAAIRVNCGFRRYDGTAFAIPVLKAFEAPPVIGPLPTSPLSDSSTKNCRR
jgi:hypothetical protein